MSGLTLAVCCSSAEHVRRQFAALPPLARFSRLLILAAPQTADALRSWSNGERRLLIPALGRDVQILETTTYFSGATLSRVLSAWTGDYLLLFLPGYEVRIDQRAVDRLLSVAEETAAGIVYSDYREEQGHDAIERPTIDYQLGSIRDTFDFGPVILISRRVAEEAVRSQGSIRDSLRWGALYDLRLKMAVDGLIFRIPEFLYSGRRALLSPTARRQKQSASEESSDDGSASGEASYEAQFEYVDPRRREYQLEMEHVATEHLRRIGAYLGSDFRTLPDEAESPSSAVMASVVIPVRNRERTIADAVRSALGQVTTFPFNVLVIDNHSSDQTSSILQELASGDRRLIHRVPERTDLEIGGCWNEAIYSDACGRYAVQLDSDDLYAHPYALQKLITAFSQNSCAMVIGSYTLVDFELKQVPPGLIDHREWTRESGRNNALRVNGLGAPRAFHVPTLRCFGFPNVSYGEDYAVALRISREYEIGRLFESVYLCRRWAENSDAKLPQVTTNRYDAYKDRIRTIEILARIRAGSGL